MKIKCLICNEIIELKYRYNLVSCKCKNCYVDGGQEYLHFGENNFSKILIIFDDYTELLASDEENYKKEYSKWEKKKFEVKIMKDILNTVFQKLINEKKGFKLIAWIFIILIILAIIFYPIIDANFLYYNRTNKRIEVIQKVVSIKEEDIKRDSRIEEEYNSILNDMNSQSNNYISNIFQKETNKGKNIAKFISGAWLFIIVGAIMPFSLDKNKGKRNIMGGILCIGIGAILGFFGYKIPNIINFAVNIILYQIILIFLAYTIATSGKKAQ